MNRTRWIGAVVLLLLLVAPVAAWAHQVLLRSSPADEAELTEVPRQLRLVFSEPADLTFTRVELVDPDGVLVPLSDLRLEPDSPNVVLADIEGPTTPGEHTVAWRSVGRDGHAVRGRFSFTVLPDAAGITEPEEAPAPPVHHDPRVFPERAGFDAGSPAYVAVRWLLFAGMLGLIGTVAFRLLVLPVVRRGRIGAGSALIDPAAHGAARLGLAMAALVLVVAVARLFAQSYAVYGPEAALSADSLRALFGTIWGTAWILQAGAAALALTGFIIARRGSVAGWALSALGAVAIAFTPGLSGHAVGTPELAALAVLSDAVHVLAAGGWLGGLLVVIAVGVPAALRLGEGQRGPAIAALVNAFSPTALAFGGTVVATGIFAAWLHVGTVEGLWTTAYGRTLLLKAAVLSVLFATGAYNFLRVRPALGTEKAARRLNRSSAFELAVAVVVLLVTAVLVAMPTPQDVGMAEDPGIPGEAVAEMTGDAP
jgi:putative copper export protein/methionine-rich copper-binding protein CopC